MMREAESENTEERSFLLLSESIKAIVAIEVKRQLDALIPLLIAQIEGKIKGGKHSPDPVRIPTDSRGLPLPR